MIDNLLAATLERMIERRSSQRILLTIDGLIVSGVPAEERAFVEALGDNISVAAPETEPVIHLRDVIIASNGNSHHVAVWRGRLASVTGWSVVGSDVLDALEESWQRNEAAYRYLAER